MKKLRFKKVTFIIQIILFTLMIFVSPFVDNNGTNEFLLTCEGKFIYPLRFLYVWLSDFVSALVSIGAIMYEKRFVSDKGRLRLARKMDIGNLTDDIL